MSSAVAVERYADAERFLEAARPWLDEAEAENNLILGTALAWRVRQAGTNGLIGQRLGTASAS